MTVELAVIGAGPAGMAAAVLAAELGLETVLIDEQAAPGGQIYRAIERAEPGTPLGPDYLAGRPLVAALRASHVDYRPGTTLWHVDPEGALFLENAGRTETMTARRILLATGALERPVPIPGWTLPGVMTAGAAQILLKSAGLVPEGRVVLAGQGPLLYLVAAQLARAGAAPVALFETAPIENYLSAMRPFGGLGAGRRLLIKGLGLISAIKRAGVPIRRGVRGLRAVGRRRLERIVWEDGELAADYLLLHEGVIPERPGQPCLAAAARVGRGTALLAAIPRCLGADESPQYCHRRRWRRYFGGRGGGAERTARRPRCRDVARPYRCGRARSARRTLPASARPRTGRAAVSRSALSPGTLGHGPGRRRGHRLPLRRSVGRSNSPRRAAGRPGSEPDQGFHPVWDGAVPGTDLRTRWSPRSPPTCSASRLPKSAPGARALRSSRSRSAPSPICPPLTLFPDGREKCISAPRNFPCTTNSHFISIICRRYCRAAGSGIRHALTRPAADRQRNWRTILYC